MWQHTVNGGVNDGGLGGRNDAIGVGVGVGLGVGSETGFATAMLVVAVVVVMVAWLAMVPVVETHTG